ncbi:UPF0182 family protein [Jatrophihabitans endophyticus]|uniref:UPF0182 family protein n=1 Tax=Jatrophihabitans endophyticus TaxID=1206085 RepID=UPI0019EAA641|nr:UPF0182 family protein [Jatrophihabitans endophyticus]MBE7188091.1 UPF0182 family protein [Jatrophihabitans endophyticus]
MPSKQPGPKQKPPAGVTKLLSGRSLLKGASRRRAFLRRWVLRLVALVVALVVLWKLFVVAVGIATSKMWFDSVNAGHVYTTMLGAKILLFCVFGIIAAVVSGLTLFFVRRIPHRLRMSTDHDTFRWTFLKYEHRVGWVLVALAAIVPGVVVGNAATNGWQKYLLWRHAVPAHTTDPLFHKDVSFYLEVYPFHVLVVSLLTQAVVYALWIAVVGGYWYGAWRIRRGHRKVTRGIVVLVSLLAALYLALKAAGYWVSRYSLTTSNRGPVTGPSHTDIDAGLPSRYVMVGIALALAVLLLVNVVRLGRVRVLAVGLVVAVVASAAVGNAWPSLFYRFGEAPSAAKVDRSEIEHNQKATLAAFGLDGDVKTVSYSPSKGLDTAALTTLAKRTAQISLNDPNQISPTFNVLQQLQAYYGFKSTLDVDHYTINGKSQDVDIAARELQSGGIPGNSWVNKHLVYTHGYGVVAAPTDKVDPKTESPVFLDGGIPPKQQIPVTRPQIYFGQAFSPSSYAIVGRPTGSKRNLEFDHPGSNGSGKSAFTTYQGHGGIRVGSLWRRLLFAVSLHSPNVLFSSELNSASQLLTVRSPRARVAKVAPWLTLDGDAYPAVVNGHIKYIVDGYTSSSTYPYSQKVNLRSATTTTLTSNGSTATQASRNVNYLHDSVKAVVDAYTGKVTLYSWNQKQQPDPLLQTWESVFPGLVKPQSSIPNALLSQLRYPTDLFNVQRYLLAKYHVTGAGNFYSGNDFWKVPVDPTVAGTNATVSSNSNLSQPSRYMSMSDDGYGGQQFSLSSPMVTLNGRDLASFIYVNSQPGPDQGKFTVLKFPAGADVESPAQVQNDIESDTAITDKLTLARGGNSQVVLGSLEAIPLAGRILWVEPVYTKSKGGTVSYPILRHVIALYGNGSPSFEKTLPSAIRHAVASANTTK